MAKRFNPEIPEGHMYGVVERPNRYEVWQAKPLMCLAKIPTDIINQRWAAQKVASALEFAHRSRQIANQIVKALKVDGEW